MNETLEERVDVLERQMAEVAARLIDSAGSDSESTADAKTLEELHRLGVRIPQVNDYRTTYGAARNDSHFDAAVKAGGEWRAEVNKSSLEELNRNEGTDADS